MMNQVTIQVDASESPDTPEHSKGNPLFIWLLSLIAFGMPATPSQAQTPTHRDVEYAKIGDRSLQVDLYLPTVNDNGKSPLVVWVHGGAWRAGSKDSVPVKHWLNSGFAIASVDYRLSGEAKFPAQVYDIKAAIRFLRASADRFRIDSSRFVVAGSSAGGHLAALVGVSNGAGGLEGMVGEHQSVSSDVQAAVSFYGASNLQTILSQSTEHGLSVRVPALQLLLGGQPDEKPDLARLASPVTYVDASDPPLWLIHGDADPQMPMEQSVELEAAYSKYDLPVQFDVIKGGKHGGDEFYTRDRLSGLAASLHQHLHRRSSPNIVFILADDLGYGDLSCYGADQVATPNIDRLAKQGRRFTDAHSPHSVCTPTRYSLLTGRYAWRTWNGSGTLWSNDPLLIERDRPTIASLLKSAGYTTACIGKWHLGFGSPDQPGWDDLLGPDYNRALKPGPLECGFDYFFGIPHVGQLPHVYIRDHHVVGVESLEKPMRLVLDPNPIFHKPYLERPRHIGKVPWHTFENIETISYEHEELGLRLTEEAVSWIGEQSSDEPFFLYFAHRNPHTPLRPNPKFLGSSKIGKYGDFLNELDWCVGQLLNALEEKNLADQTLVILSSDNGGIAKYVQMDDAVTNGHRINGPLRGQKTQAYEGGHRVPLLVRWPGKVAAGSTSDALIALTDVFATFAELTGQSVPPGAAEDSFSFLPHLIDRDAQSPPRESLVADGYLNVFSIRKGPWKLIQSQGGGGIRENPEDLNPSQPVGQLYHLGDDLNEHDNLYASQPEKVRELTELLSEIRKPIK